MQDQLTLKHKTLTQSCHISMQKKQQHIIYLFAAYVGTENESMDLKYWLPTKKKKKQKSKVGWAKFHCNANAVI